VKRSRVFIFLLALLFFLTLLAPGCKQAYSPREGDILFQSLPKHDLVVAIEGITKSPYSHCGVVTVRGNRFFVVEGIGPVKETPVRSFVRRGRGRTIDVYRLKPPYRDRIPEFIEAMRAYAGRPYDFRYRMDDEKIYCSELIYKAFKKIYGEELGKPRKLGDMNWKPHVETIRKYEGGSVPHDRQIISPRAVSEAEQVEPVFKGMK
jgi:hypothetical protein